MHAQTDKRRVCPNCEKEFVFNSHHHKYCSDKCRWNHHDRVNPKYISATRARNKSWSIANRSVRKNVPALLGAPPYNEYLPGGAFSMSVTPVPQWPIELRNTRGLHGMVTSLFGEPHKRGMATFSLVSSRLSPIGWGVYANDAELARGFANRRMPMTLFSRPVELRTGHLFRIKAPVVGKRGWRDLRVDFITPTCIRSDGSRVMHGYPSASNLSSSLCTMIPQRLGIDGPLDRIALKLVSRSTMTESVPLGGKYGVVTGFTGHCIVRCNAVAHWFLLAGETLGFGSRTAFGFGRIKVSLC